MICSVGFYTTQISAYVEGELPAEATQEFEEHLSECPECRTQLGQIKALLKAAADFAGTEPGRDLWSDIEGRLVERTASGKSTHSSANLQSVHRWFRAPYRRITVAASVVLLLVSASISIRNTGGGRPTPDPATGAIGMLDSEFSASLDSLDATFRQLVSEIAPGDSALATMVLEVLETLDEVIEDARRDLLDDPSDPLRHRYYARTARKKAEALRRGLMMMGQV